MFIYTRQCACVHLYKAMPNHSPKCLNQRVKPEYIHSLNKCLLNIYYASTLFLELGSNSGLIFHCCVASVVSDPVRPHGLQPTRLHRPWDSPGKNTGVGCHFLLQCMKVESESKVTQSCPTLRPHGLQPTRLLHPWDFPGNSTGVGCHCLLHGDNQ